jgi:hypothetical protein
MIKEKALGSEFVDALGNNISSWWTLAEEQLLYEKQKLNKVSDTPSRNSKTNSFQNGRTEFRIKANLNMKEFIEAMPRHA